MFLIGYFGGVMVAVVCFSYLGKSYFNLAWVCGVFFYNVLGIDGRFRGWWGCRYLRICNIFEFNIVGSGY